MPALTHAEIEALLPHTSTGVILDAVSAFECLKRAKGGYFWAIPEALTEQRLSEARFVATQCLLQTAGVAVFCDKGFRGKLMDVLAVKSASYDLGFQKTVAEAEALTVLELCTDAELIVMKDSYARAVGQVIHEDMVVITLDFFFWLLTPEELTNRGGVFPDPEELP